MLSDSRFVRGLRAKAPKYWRRPSLIARQALILYTVLVVIASLFPFVGWRDIGVEPFEYLRADWPRIVFKSLDLQFDFTINLLGYLPLGLLASFAVYPRIRGVWSVLFSTLYCAALSSVLEALQTYLPTRFASRIDLLANTVGGLVGALLALKLAEPVLERGRLRSVYQRWFEADAGFGLVLIALWFGAVTFPDPFALGIGGALRPLVDWVVPGPESVWPNAWSTANFVAAEAAVCALALTGAGALLLRTLQPTAPQKSIAAALIAFTMLAKTIAQGIAGGEGALGWITEGAAWGFAIGSPALLALTALPRKWLPLIGCCALFAAIALTNLAPDNPYYDAAEHAWASRRLGNFYGVSVALNFVWPFLALWYLLWPRMRVPRQGRL